MQAFFSAQVCLKGSTNYCLSGLTVLICKMGGLDHMISQALFNSPFQVYDLIPLVM